MVTKHRVGYVFKRGSNYYLQYMVDGRRVKKVLRDEKGKPVTTAEAAESARQKIMAPLFVADRETALRNVRHQLDDVVQERAVLERGTELGLPLAKAWVVFVDSVNRPDSGPRTLAGYAAQWTAFVNWMVETHVALTEMRQVSFEVAQEYASYMLREIRKKVKIGRKQVEKDVVVKRAFTTNTYNKHVRVLELVFRVLTRKAGLTVNPWSEIARKTENKASRRELTVKELNAICNAASGELQALLVLGIYTGLRLGDCCTLRWSEVDMDRRMILRVPNKTARRKATPVHVPIHLTLAAFLARTPVTKRHGFVLPGFAAQYKTNDSDVAKGLRKHFIACGIQVHKDGTGGETGSRASVEVGFHSLRHSFVSLCRQANAPLSVVEAIVGHSNPSMTRHYTHVGDVAAETAVAALPAIGTGEKATQKKSRAGLSKPGANAGADAAAVLVKVLADVARLTKGLTVENMETTRKELLAMVKAAVATGQG